MKEEIIETYILLCTRTQPLGVREAAALLKVSKSAVHRSLQTLVKIGLARQPFKNGGYVLGIRAYGLANVIVSRFDLIELVRPVLQELTEKTGESSYFGLYSNSKLSFFVKEETKHPIQYIYPLFADVVMYAGASGKVVLAALSEDEVNSIIDKGKMEAFTENTISDPHVLKAQLAEIRQQGYAFSIEEKQVGAVGIASAVLSLDSSVVGCVVLSLPTLRFELDKKDWLAQAVKAAAQSLSQSLGVLP